MAQRASRSVRAGQGRTVQGSPHIFANSSFPASGLADARSAILRPMSFLIRRVFRFAAQKVAADPRVREKAGEYVRFVSEEARVIARDEDRARAAGRSVRRFLNRVQADRQPGRDGDDESAS